MVKKDIRGGNNSVSQKESNNASDNASFNRIDISNDYEKIEDANYGGDYGNLKGGCKKCMKGGCFTCKHTKRKSDNAYKLFIIAIPKYFKLYSINTRKTPNKKIAIKSTDNRHKRHNHHKRRRGGNSYMSDWDGRYVWKQNVNNDGDLYNNNILDISSLGNTNQRQTKGIYSLDTSLTNYTSTLAR